VSLFTEFNNLLIKPLHGAAKMNQNKEKLISSEDGATGEIRRICMWKQYEYQEKIDRGVPVVGLFSTIVGAVRYGAIYSTNKTQMISILAISFQQHTFTAFRKICED
jgi:hypothetical protein